MKKIRQSTICAKWLFNDLRYQIHKIALVSCNIIIMIIILQFMINLPKISFMEFVGIVSDVTAESIIPQKRQIFREMFAQVARDKDSIAYCLAGWQWQIKNL